MGALQDYLRGMAVVHATGEAVEETSYYGQVETLLNTIGGRLSPKILCVLTTRNRGAGVPDGGLFLASNAVEKAGREALTARVPERGVLEAKGPAKAVQRIARTQQVQRYLNRYGKVLVTTYREFLLVSLDKDGQPVEGEVFTLASDEPTFWSLANSPSQVTPDLEEHFEDYLKRVLLGDAPLSQPADLAWFLAAYAREGRRRLDTAGAKNLRALKTLRRALEEGLGLRFEGAKGEGFFRSALVQTLFYGIFAAWVVWSESVPAGSTSRFSWRSAQWTLKVPMVRVLFQQLATPATLPVGLDEVLDWTEDALARVDRDLFFEGFESGDAVQYFYEPFLEAYDPELRRQLGVWYTPPEVVRYMVERVHQALREDLGLELGLADDNVHVLDPCTGTGSFLVETVNTIARVLQERHGDALVAQDAKAAALRRVYGFELLPAPFVVAHLNVGLTLERLGAPLVNDERAKIYLTNALTGWSEREQQTPLPFPEFEEERDAAAEVKRVEPILVVIGNPPYNGFAGVSGSEEGGLVEPYKRGLAETWDITKNKLDDLYIRFFRIAERRIAEQTGKGVVCFISNMSWLGDPSTVVMRQRIVKQFDRIYVDNLNGDSRETGKKTPAGLNDPSIFSTRLNPSGIQVGTAISLLVRREAHDDQSFDGSYRDFWGPDKRTLLSYALTRPNEVPSYVQLAPSKENWFRLRRWAPRQGYDRWPSVLDLAALDPLLGLNENRGEALISLDRNQLLDRIGKFLDSETRFEELGESVSGLTKTWARYDPHKVRDRLLNDSPFSEAKVVRFCVKPFDIRWAYVDTTGHLWNESRPELVKAATLGSDFLLLRRRSPRALDGAAFLMSRSLIDQHVMHKDAYVIPYWTANEDSVGEDAHPGGTMSMFTLDGDAEYAEKPAWRPNLSERATTYLSGLGINDVEHSQSSAQLIWQHVLAIGYSPLYLEENDDALHNDWPRVPLPSTYDELIASANLGERVSNLLDIDTTMRPEGSGWLGCIARIQRVDGDSIAPSHGDLAINAGWAVVQTRTQKSGAVSSIVMPGRGHIVIRESSAAEREGASNEERELLGADVIDVYLNDQVYWQGVPEAVWDFKIGGFQVLRKWLSYRDKRVLGRDLTISEAREFTSICLRLTQLILLTPELDRNYLTATGALASETL